MGQFDVYRLADGGMVLDCQSDLLDDIGTRFVLPLMPEAEAPLPNPHLNPSLVVNGEPLRLTPQFAVAVRTSELRQYVGSLSKNRDVVIRAIDT